MILFENVTKTYPKTKRPALNDVSLEIPRGEFAFVVGKSGSGKSTLLQLVIKEQDASEGRILVAGRALARLPDRKVPALRREIGCVFQDFRLLPNKTVFQNVAYALQVLGYGRSRIRQTVPETLELVGLAGKEKRFPHQLSGG
ncbi:MAG: ATP-binding cassette domain-containing protein, partial [Dermatophilaceae bacterium]